MREIDVGELLTSSDLPFVRHHLDPEATDRAWVSGRAVVTDGTVSRWADSPPGPVRTCLGPVRDLAPLMADVDAVLGAPWRVTVEEAAAPALPTTWRQADPRTWHWMATRTATPDPGPAGHAVVEVDDTAVERVLERANPDSFARPGTARVECWLGLGLGLGHGLGDLAIVAVGALVRQVDGTGHLRGVSVLPEHRGHGLGRALSVALTRRALAGPAELATLGVYADNAPALTIYRALGYRTVHTMSSGLVG